MVKPVLKLFLIIMVACQAAFHPSTEEAVIQQVARWGPRDALVLFKDFHREFWVGFESGRSGGGPTVKELDTMTMNLVEAINSQSPMAVVVKDWGRLSCRALQFSDPTLSPPEPGSDSRAIRDFPHLVLLKQKRVPVVFYGFDRSFLKGNFQHYLRGLEKRQNSWMKLLLLDYGRLGPEQSYRAFDDRGNAFGVVSFSLNHAFTAVLHFWYYIWRQAGGRWGPLTPKNTPDKMWVVANGY